MVVLGRWAISYERGTVAAHQTPAGACPLDRERVLYWQPTGPNLLSHRDDWVDRPRRNGNLNSLVQAALHPPVH